MLMGDTGTFLPRDCGYHVRWLKPFRIILLQLKNFPLFRNFFALPFSRRTGRYLGIAGIWHSIHCHPSGERLLKCLVLSPVVLGAGDVFGVPVIEQGWQIPAKEPFGALPVRQLPRQRKRGFRHRERTAPRCLHSLNQHLPQCGRLPLNQAFSLSRLV